MNKSVNDKLIKIANVLDFNGIYDLADEVTSVMERVAQMNAIEQGNTKIQADMNAILQKALSAHSQNKSGWSTLRSLMGNLSESEQSWLSQQFMAKTKQFGTNPTKLNTQKDYFGKDTGIPAPVPQKRTQPGKLPGSLGQGAIPTAIDGYSKQVKLPKSAPAKPEAPTGSMDFLNNAIKKPYGF